ncbi:gastrula zinc finger protein xFG20-1 isoform X2 [Lates calcarifer]|uniref:Gastrula zinc finger protein xFG20-1 isoform X1 n=1 Tax=Lates calcarifer TaxID=8187 RepID=A0AAJ8B3P2_LATCA|nr:gastrula zinc finger protein xFG20-1 isoform X1 [Lates calcarifer]XP_050925681.1 gastrula zinc finger protein xFG20-1 isoform X2 [Lates calcarifer]
MSSSQRQVIDFLCFPVTRSTVQQVELDLRVKQKKAAEPVTVTFRFSCKMSQIGDLRVLVRRRLAAAAEEICGVLDLAVGGLEEEVRRQRRLLDTVLNPEIRLQRADVEQLLRKEEVPPEHQEWSPSLDQEDPEPPHIKEEQEEVWSSQEGEQLQGLEEADITKFTFTPVPVKSEDDEEKPQSSEPHQSQTEENREDCGGPGPDRNPGLDPHLQPQTEDSDFRKPLSCLKCLKHDVSQSDPTCGTDRKQVSLNQQTGREENQDPEPPCIKEEQEEIQLFKQAEITKFAPMKTEEHREDCGGPEMAKNLGPYTHVQPKTEDQKETREPWSGLNPLMDDEVPASEKVFTCCDCGKMFSHKRLLLSHMTCHTGEKLFSCSVCGKRFTHRVSLKQHMTQHNRQRPAETSQPSEAETFDCSECGRRFSRKDTLQGHMVTHTGERPFRCSECGKTFGRKTNLTAHMRIHTGEKRFGCTICRKSFTWQHQLKNHQCVGRSADSGGSRPAMGPVLMPRPQTDGLVLLVYI